MIEWDAEHAFRFGRRRYVDIVLSMKLDPQVSDEDALMVSAFEASDDPDDVVQSLLDFIDALWGGGGGTMQPPGVDEEFGLCVRATALRGRSVRLEADFDFDAPGSSAEAPGLSVICDRDALAEALYRSWRRLALRWDDYGPRAAVNFAAPTACNAAGREWVEPLPLGLVPPPDPDQR